MLLTGPFAMLSMPSFDFHFATMYERLPHPPLPTMAIATLAIATVSLGGTISLCRGYMRSLTPNGKDMHNWSQYFTSYRLSRGHLSSLIPNGKDLHNWSP